MNTSTKQAFKTLKWFSLEWDEEVSLLNISIIGTLFNNAYVMHSAKTQEQAFDWLEANGYIERIKG